MTWALRKWEEIRYLVFFTLVLIAGSWVEGSEDLVLLGEPIWKYLAYGVVALVFGLWFAMPRQD